MLTRITMIFQFDNNQKINLYQNKLEEKNIKITSQKVELQIIIILQKNKTLNNY